MRLHAFTELAKREGCEICVWYSEHLPGELEFIRGGYARIYFKFTILKNDMHRARAARAHTLAPRAKVGGMSQL
jgi:hypothetical protein